MSKTSNIAELERVKHEIGELREELSRAMAATVSAREQARQKIQTFVREFRVPLTTVLGFSDILSATDKAHRVELNQIAIAGHQLMEMITNLEGSSNETSAKTDPEKEAEPLPALLHTVLHIEDNESNFRLIERILEDRPHIELLWAPTGEQGMTMVDKHSPSLILLDLNLPDTHGSELLARLQKNPLTKNIPVIVLSADASPSRIERMLQSGARNYLIKPFDIKRLLCLVDETLEAATQPAA